MVFPSKHFFSCCFNLNAMKGKWFPLAASYKKPQATNRSWAVPLLFLVGLTIRKHMIWLKKCLFKKIKALASMQFNYEFLKFKGFHSFQHTEKANVAENNYKIRAASWASPTLGFISFSMETIGLHIWAEASMPCWTGVRIATHRSN